MAQFEIIYPLTATSGTTVNLAVTDAATLYLITGSSTLLGNYVLQPTGSPTEGIQYTFKYKAQATYNGGSVVINFGGSPVTLTQEQALSRLTIECLYTSGAWNIEVYQDANDSGDDYQGVTETTVPNGGGTVTLTPGISKQIQRYIGSPTLVASYNIQGGTATAGDEFFVHWDAACTTGVNTVTIFGNTLSTNEALQNDLLVYAYYTGSAWIGVKLPGMVYNGSIVNAMLANMPALSVKANPTNSSAVPQDLAASAASTLLKRGASNTLLFEKLLTADIDTNQVTNTKLAQMAAFTLKGNNTALLADPQDLTVSDIQSLLGIVFEAGAGTLSAIKIGSTSTAAGDYSTALGEGDTASGNYTLTAGQDNTASNDWAIALGFDNIASGLAAIALGESNTASGTNAFAVGNGNIASSTRTIALGEDNQATSVGSIAIGRLNISSGDLSAAIGDANQATEATSLATGYAAIAGRIAQHSHSSGRHNAGDTTTFAQSSNAQAYVVTSDATPSIVYIDGSSERILIPANTLCNIYIKVSAVQQAGASGTVGDSAVFDIMCSIKNISGVTALIGSPLYMDSTGAWTTTPDVRSADAAAATWDATVTADNTNDAISITVTGQANKTIYWHTTLIIDEIKYA